VTVVMAVIGIGRNASSTKLFDKAWEKACRDAKIGVRNFHIFQPNAPVAQWIEQRIPNPLAASSILARGTNRITRLAKCLLTIFYFF
jgi:hypothetical protein